VRLLVDEIPASVTDEIAVIVVMNNILSELVEKAGYENRIQGLRSGAGSEIRTGADWLHDRARKAVAEGISAAQA
jgi:hypothetical protein